MLLIDNSGLAYDERQTALKTMPKDNMLGMTLRLSPSSMRFSHNLRIEHAQMLGEACARLLCKDEPHVYKSSHLENLKEWADGDKFCWTDKRGVVSLFHEQDKDFCQAKRDLPHAAPAGHPAPLF